jgi:hypothetical protein
MGSVGVLKATAKQVAAFQAGCECCHPYGWLQLRQTAAGFTRLVKEVRLYNVDKQRLDCLMQRLA